MDACWGLNIRVFSGQSRYPLAPTLRIMQIQNIKIIQTKIMKLPIKITKNMYNIELKITASRIIRK